MRDAPDRPMTVESVEAFKVCILNSEQLVVSMISHEAPSSIKTEAYQLSGD